MLIGAFIPPPVLGSLLCMMVGAFLGAWLVERKRARDRATHIAWGTVFAKLAVIGIKFGATAIMSAILLLGLFG